MSREQGRPWAAAVRFGEAVSEYTDCTAVLGLVAPLRNSLHSLRSLWSNRRNESEHEARGYARRPRALRSSSPHRRAQQQPRAGLAGDEFFSVQARANCWLARGRCGVGATVRSREAQGF